MTVRSLTKLKAGIQDLLFGRGTTSQSRNGTDYNIERIAIIKPVDLLVDLKALVTTDEDAQYFEAQMKGGGAINDGSQGTYYFDAASTATPDDTLVVKPDDVTLPNPGRWHKVLAEGVDRAGDTMTGQLKGITPVAADDFTRKDYVDANFNKYKAGPTVAGVTAAYSANLNDIAVNSIYYASAAVVTNAPAQLGGSGFFIIETMIGADTTERFQLITVLTTGQARKQYNRTYAGSWSAWQSIDDVYDLEGSLLTQFASVNSAVNYLQVVNAALGNAPALNQLGADNVGINIEGLNINANLLKAALTNANLLLEGNGNGFVKADTSYANHFQGVGLYRDTKLELWNSGSENTWNAVTLAAEYAGAKAAIVDVVHRSIEVVGDGYESSYLYLRKYDSGAGVTEATRVSSQTGETNNAGASNPHGAAGGIIIPVDTSRRFQWYHGISGNGVGWSWGYLVGVII